MQVREAEHKTRIRGMFDSVAPRYDLLNRCLSAGIDTRWRKHAVRELKLEPGHTVLDLCTGTADLGLEACRRAPGVRVVGVDLAAEMLRQGRRKVSGTAVSLVHADAERLPLATGSQDRACVGFGIRNVTRLDVALRETARVLRPGGRFVILEFTTPPNPVFRGLYHAYFHHLLPGIGRWVSGHPDAYRYLPDSVAAFPGPAALVSRMEDAGFRNVRYRLLTAGIAALHVGERA